MKKGYMYIILTALIFSTVELVGKMIATEVNPFELNIIRFFIGGVMLLPFSLYELRKRGVRLNKDDVKFFFLTGLLCIPISMSFYQLAIVYTKASTVAVVFSTNPIFTLPFAALMLKEKVTKKNIYAILLSFLGVLVIFNPLKMNADYIGIGLSLIAAVSFSLYSVVCKMKVDRYGGVALNCFTFLAGDLLMVPFIFLLKIPLIQGINHGTIIQVMYLSIVVSGIGYVFYSMAMKETSAVKASTVFFIKPALAPILAMLIIHEKLGINILIGIIFILLGSYISFKDKYAEEKNLMSA